MARRRMIDHSDWKERYFKKATMPVGLRNSVIIRDKGICRICGKQGITENFHGRLRVFEEISQSHRIPFEIDHIVAEVIGGTMELDNLQLTCRRCNRSKKTKPLEVSGDGQKENDRPQLLGG